MRKVIITREHFISKELQKKLLEHDFLPCHIPLIRCNYYDIPQTILKSLDKADWVFFTSRVAFEFFYPYMPDKVKIATIGPATSHAVKKRGFTIDFEASEYYARDFAKEWLSLELAKQKILLPQSRLSSQDLAILLSKKGHDVLNWILYETEADEKGQRKIPSFIQEKNAIWTFASPSAWRSFVTGGGFLSLSQEFAVIGKSTERAITECDYRVTYRPDEPSIERMIHEIIQQNRVTIDGYGKEKD